MNLDELWRKNESLYKRYDRITEKIQELEDRENAPQIFELLPVKINGLRTYVKTDQSSFSYKETIDELNRESGRIYNELENLSKEINIREFNKSNPQNNKKNNDNNKNNHNKKTSYFK